MLTGGGYARYFKPFRVSDTTHPFFCAQTAAFAAPGGCAPSSFPWRCPLACCSRRCGSSRPSCCIPRTRGQTTFQIMQQLTGLKICEHENTRSIASPNNALHHFLFATYLVCKCADKRLREPRLDFHTRPCNEQTIGYSFPKSNYRFVLLPRDDHYFPIQQTMWFLRGRREWRMQFTPWSKDKRGPALFTKLPKG